MEESIYSLIPPPVENPSAPPRYRSKHEPRAPPTFSTFGLTGTSKPGYNNVAGQTVDAPGAHPYKKTHATFGTENNAHATTDLLRKGTGCGGGANTTAKPVPGAPPAPSLAARACAAHAAAD